MASFIHNSPSERIAAKVREAVAAKTLNAAAFVVYTDEQVGPDRLDFGGQLGELSPMLEVAREQDHSAGERVLQTAPIVRGERLSGDVEDDGGVAHHSFLISTTTKAAA